MTTLRQDAYARYCVFGVLHAMGKDKDNIIAMKLAIIHVLLKSDPEVQLLISSTYPPKFFLTFLDPS